VEELPVIAAALLTKYFNVSHIYNMTRWIYHTLFNSTVSAVASSWHLLGDTDENHQKKLLG
jgi:hypothetical protein